MSTTEDTTVIPTTEQIREMYVAHHRSEGSMFRSADFEFDIWLTSVEQREATILELQHPGNCENCGHRSDCALHNRPALPIQPCDCQSQDRPAGVEE